MPFKRHHLLSGLLLTATALHAATAPNPGESETLEFWRSDRLMPTQKAGLHPSPQIRSAALKVHPDGLPQYESRQVNVDAQGMNIVADAANEPSLAVNPLNPAQIAVGWRQFDSIGSAYRQAGAAYSDDAGLSWHSVGPLEPGTFRSDPVLAAGADGVFYYQSLKVEDIFGTPSTDDDVFLVDQWRSLDGGKTWIDKTFAYGGDKSWFVVDDANSADLTRIFAVWNVAGNSYFPRTYNYSLDGGLSFSEPEEMPVQPVFGTVALGPDGSLYVVGANPYTSYNTNQMLRIDGALDSPFAPGQFNQVTELVMGGGLGFSGFINPDGLDGQMWIQVDKSNRHTRGHVYVFASIKPLGPGGLNVQLTRSTDRGVSFSPVQKINRDSGNNNQWFGTMGLAPNGRLDLLWYDTRISPTGTQSQLYWSYSYDGGVTFSANQPLSPPFLHNLGYPIQDKLGDYFDVVSDNGGAHIAYAATFAGGQDVYYLYARPAAFIENPYFPAEEMNNAWADPAIPRQGIFSSMLVNSAAPGGPQNINFDAIFSVNNAGEPVWLVAQGEVPGEGDAFSVPLYLPTGDLSPGGVPLKPVGLLRKTRLYADGDLLPRRLRVEIDTRASVLDELQDALPAGAVDAAFFNDNALHGEYRDLSLTALVPGEQKQPDFCHPFAQVLANPLENSEGRVQFVYRRDGALNLVAADFTYLKTVDEFGQAHPVLDANNRAIPTWQVITSNAPFSDNAVHSRVDASNGGEGFFLPSGTDPGLTEFTSETLMHSDGGALQVEKDNGEMENLSVTAANSYCGH